MITNKLTLYLISIISFITGLVLFIAGSISLVHILTSVHAILISAANILLIIDFGVVLIMVMSLFACSRYFWTLMKK